MNRDILKLVAAGGAGLILGAGISAVVTHRVMIKKFQKMVDELVGELQSDMLKEFEIRDANRETRRNAAIERGKKAVQKKSVAEYADIVRENQYDSVIESDTVDLIDHEEATLADIRKQEEVEASINTVEVRPESEARKMTPEEAEDIDYGDSRYLDMKAKRSPETAYLITIDEFSDEEPHFDKLSLTYFEGDDILCDERDQVIPDVDSILGPDALDNFGLFSKDNNMVYVRNERIDTDFEITRDSRTFTDAIHGVRAIKESRGVRRMREDD